MAHAEAAHSAARPRFTGIRPMLAVTDLPRTMAFYMHKLGFQCVGTFGNPPVWCNLVRDNQEIMFNAPPRESVIRDVPVKSKDYQIFYVTVQNLAALHADLTAHGVTVSPMRVTVYGMKEFDVRDPDDYWLMFGESTDEAPTVTE